MDSFSHLLMLSAGCLIVVRWLDTYVRERRANPNRLPLPPGPKGYPIIGNLFDLPLHKPWLVYNDWFQMYGDMIYLNVLGHGFLILGSLEKIYDIFEKRSNNYSDRPPMPMIVDLMGWDFNMAMMPYGSWWRRHRRAFHNHFNSNVVSRYRPIQTSSARAFLRNLLESPDEFMSIIRLTFATTILKVAYGITVKDWDDKYVKNVEEALQGIVEAGTPGRFLVDVFPIMKYVPSWLPGAGWKRKAKYYWALNYKVSNEPFELVKEQMKEGNAIPSICTQLIESLPEEGHPDRMEEEAIARGTCAVAYAGGADTTVSAVQTFFLAMCLYPEVQKKAQAELDAVLQGRLPEFHDRPSLPYINAMVKETMRWHPVTPIGFGHSSTSADEYNGYYIPKGTLVIGSTWAILRDPQVFRDPEEYIPDRYLKGGAIDPAVRDPFAAAFGYGRRICPGRFFSDESLFSIIAHVLAVYDIRPGLDGDGNEIKLKPEYTDGLISYPVKFPCRITPRSKAATLSLRGNELAFILLYPACFFWNLFNTIY